MDAVVVHVRLVLQGSQKEIARLTEALRSLVRRAALDPHCAECAVWTHADDGLAVLYEERWSDEGAVRRHVNSSDFTRLLAVVETAPEPPVLMFEFVDQCRGLDYVSDVRGQGLPEPGTSPSKEFNP